MSKLIKSLSNFKFIIFLFAATLIVLLWKNYFPDRYVFACGGNNISETTNLSDNSISRTNFHDENIVIIIKYFWGINYTIDYYTKAECAIDRFQNSILCTRGEHGTPQYRYAKFNIDTARFSYQWSLVREDIKYTHRTEFGKENSCIRISNALEN
jgi:hypothetical protein